MKKHKFPLIIKKICFFNNQRESTIQISHIDISIQPAYKQFIYDTQYSIILLFHTSILDIYIHKLFASRHTYPYNNR